MSNRGLDSAASRQLKLFVGLVVVFAVAPLAWSFIRIIDQFHITNLTSILFAAAICGANLAITDIRVRATRQSVSPTSAAVLVCIAFTPGSWVIACTFVGLFLAKAFMRASPEKVAFNAAKDTLAASAALIGVHTLGFTPTPLGVPLVGSLLDHLPVLAVAAAAYGAVDESLSAIVLGLASNTPIRQRVLSHLDTRLIGRFGSYVISVFALWMYSVQPWLLTALPPLIYALHLTSANRIRGRNERFAWQKLAQATDELNVVDIDAVVRTAVRRAASLFSADEVDLLVRQRSAPARLVRGDADNVLYDGALDGAPTARGYLIETMLEGPRDAGDIGQLLLRFRGTVRLSERERYTLSTFTAALCTAIRNAEAFAEARRLADIHAKAAAHDALTGLANRRRLQEYGTEVLSTRPAHGITALVLIDLNHFKEVNDTLGHSAGDRVLVEVAHRLAGAVQAEDLVARLGGDEFAILFVGLTAPAVAIARAHTVLATLSVPMELDGMLISVEASAGVATAPATGGIIELLRRADVAMYRAKRNGQRVATYVRSRDTADVGSLALGGDLARAITDHQFIVEFQPIIDLGSGEVIAAEALARWDHPERGQLGPDRFLAAVERSGQLAAFAEAVLDQALATASEWIAEFPVSVAVNVSPRSLLDPSFPDVVLSRLASHDVPTDKLVIELTETVTLSQLEVVDQVLGALREAGIRLALDDFGTGYSSLSTLARVPVYELKIDRSFVSAMETSSAAAAVVRSTIDLGRSLNLQVVAEGVESEDQRQRLWELGCPAGQGHLFARPMTGPRLLAALEEGCDGRRGALVPQIHDAGSVIRMPPSRRGRTGGQQRSEQNG